MARHAPSPGEPLDPGALPSFVPGLELSRQFYTQAVRPILHREFPGLAYSAALLGWGSDVLGFDTPQSMDHGWGPRLLLFLPEAGFEAYRDRVDHRLRRELPTAIHGFPTHFRRHEDGSAVMAAVEEGPVDHGVRILTVRGMVRRWLGVEIDAQWSAAEWLTFPDQILRSMTAGAVFHDGLGQLEPLRARLAATPHDVWLYRLAAQWRRIAQEEHILGRCGQAGDELGSRLVAARLVRDLMRLCFLMERQYAPYIKWLGTAFQRLGCAERLGPVLEDALRAPTWQARGEALCSAYEMVAGMHNALGVTEPLAGQVSAFHSRPFCVIHADRFADALRAAITDPEVRALPDHLGSIDQWVDSTDVLSYPARACRLRPVYRGAEA
jgi:hypothetical protein